MVGGAGMKSGLGEPGPWGPKCSPETQQSKDDKASSRRPLMVRILRGWLRRLTEQISGDPALGVEWTFCFYTPNSPSLPCLWWPLLPIMVGRG